MKRIKCSYSNTYKKEKCLIILLLNTVKIDKTSEIVHFPFPLVQIILFLSHCYSKGLDQRDYILFLQPLLIASKYECFSQ